MKALSIGSTRSRKTSADYKSPLLSLVSHCLQAIGHTGKLQNKGDFVTGKIAGTSYVVVRGEDMQLRAFHNVCSSLLCSFPILGPVFPNASLGVSVY